MSRATLEKDPREVASMFDGVARRYDITNTVLSLGQDRYWRRATRSALGIGPGDKVLDLAAGTAVSTVELASSGRVVRGGGLLGRDAGRRCAPARCPRSPATRRELPFADDVFDAVTISFGLRNVVDHEAGLREMARVTRPGGRLVVCEFSTPTNALFATVYKEYLMQALPRVARAVSSNPDAYVYLAESIRAWPDQAELARRIARRRMVGGAVAQPHRRHRRAARRHQALTPAAWLRTRANCTTRSVHRAQIGAAIRASTSTLMRSGTEPARSHVVRTTSSESAANTPKRTSSVGTASVM